MTEVIVLIIIAAISAIIIRYVDYFYTWDGLSRKSLIATALAFVINGWMLYDPNKTLMAVTIDLNPTWQMAMLLSYTEGLMLTVPFTLIHMLKEKHEFNKWKRDRK